MIEYSAIVLLALSAATRTFSQLTLERDGKVIGTPTNVSTLNTSTFKLSLDEVKELKDLLAAKAQKAIDNLDDESLHKL